jgi:rRNA processing protein Krr1/Pno1
VYIFNRGESRSRTNRELEELSKGENIATWIKGQRISCLGHLERMEDARKALHSRNGRDETKRKTHERMERRSRKRSTSAGSEKMERDGDR